MTTTHSQRHSERFIAAFNDIEAQFRRDLRRDQFAHFAEMARAYAVRHHLPSAQLDELLDFAALRNAISHGKYYGGRPIAEPTEEVVEDIERLREQILSPPLGLEILEERQVCVTGPDRSGSVQAGWIVANAVDGAAVVVGHLPARLESGKPDQSRPQRFNGNPT